MRDLIETTYGAAVRGGYLYIHLCELCPFGACWGLREKYGVRSWHAKICLG